MKKRALSIIIVIIICLNSVCAFAEGEQQGGLLDSIRSLLEEAKNGISNWTATTSEDASSWINNTWGDASKWINQAWSDSSDWITGIWGNASAWTSRTYDNVSAATGAWWVKTLDMVMDQTEGTWNWIRETSAGLDSRGKEIMGEIKDALADPEVTIESVREVFDGLMEKMGIDNAEAVKIWTTLLTYARQKRLSPLVVLKLVLPYLARLAIDSLMAQNSSIPAVAVAQYLITILGKLGIDTNSIAENLVILLINALNAI